MGNVLTEIYIEYILQKNSESSSKEIIENLRKKLTSGITQENINDIIDIDKENTLLHKAIFDEDTDLVQWLLQHNARLDIKNKHKVTPMRLAINTFFIEGIKLLYASGGNIDDIDISGCTGLCCAVQRGSKEQVATLLGLNANVHAINNDGQTILDSALLLIENNAVNEENKFDILKLLFENYIGIGTDFSSIDLPQGITDGMPVIWATKDGKLITNETPGFEKAICSFEKLLQSKMLNFKKLQYLLEKVFRPYFPGAENPLYSYNQMILDVHGKIRKNNFEKAGPELEQLYKTLRNRTAGLSSLKELATATLLIQHSITLNKQQPIADAKLNPYGTITLPAEVEDFIEELAADIEKKFAHTRGSNK